MRYETDNGSLSFQLLFQIYININLTFHINLSVFYKKKIGKLFRSILRSDLKKCKKY